MFMEDTMLFRMAVLPKLVFRFSPIPVKIPTGSFAAIGKLL